LLNNEEGISYYDLIQAYICNIKIPMLIELVHFRRIQLKQNIRETALNQVFKVIKWIGL